MAISIDPETGLKRFSTRAAKASEKILGKGYSLVNEESLKTLPEQFPGAVFGSKEQAKYKEFKEARRGAGDYVALEGEFADYIKDVYSGDPVKRDTLDDECEILVVGAGFAGLLLWHKLMAAGFADVRFCERGGDVGESPLVDQLGGGFDRAAAGYLHRLPRLLIGVAAERGLEGGGADHGASGSRGGQQGNAGAEEGLADHGGVTESRLKVKTMKPPRQSS